MLAGVRSSGQASSRLRGGEDNGPFGRSARDAITRVVPAMGHGSAINLAPTAQPWLGESVDSACRIPFGRVVDNRDPGEEAFPRSRDMSIYSLSPLCMYRDFWPTANDHFDSP